ncbi:MAG: (Fe-S)-binding protein [Deltaproteobacteria bacterium]|nr:(Fe-S)-binding protein [Deltaproteobacteria bacterium]
MLIESFRREIDYCTYCPKMCRFACPVAETDARETYTPTAKMTMAYLLKQGSVETSPDLAVSFFKCTACAHCKVYCDHEIKVGPVLEAARADLFVAGQTLPAAVKLAAKVRETGTPHDVPLEPVAAGIIPEKYRGPQARTAIWLGGDLIASGGERIRKLVGILDAVGAENVSVIAAGRLDTGAALYHCGDREGLRAHASEVLASLQGYDTVVTVAPEDAVMFQHGYPRVNIKVTPKVVWWVDWICEKLAGRELRAFPEPLVIHDPCEAARKLGASGRIRELLKMCGAVVREPAWSGEDTSCCGAGSAYARIFPADAKKMARRRMEELYETGTRKTVTASPLCGQHLKSSSPGVEVLDVIDVVAHSLGVQA